MCGTDGCIIAPAGVLQQLAAEQEQDRTDFLKLKQQLEMEFNQKRAKFKELYLSKEGRSNILFKISADGPLRYKKNFFVYLKYLFLDLLALFVFRLFLF